MKLIKNAIIFKAELPADVAVICAHLAEIPFEPIGEVFRSRAGFIPNAVTGELVTPLEGGYSFTVRHDEKILPKASIAGAIADAIEAYAEAHELEVDDLSEEQRGIVADGVLTKLIASALIKTTVVNCFYSEADQFLIIPTTGKPLAQTVVGLLIKATGAVRTSTIHVDDIKGGLTTRLRNHLDGDEEAFGVFKLGDTCNMKGKAGKASFSMSDLDGAKQGLQESLRGDMQVEIMELTHEGVAFRLTNDFKLRGISFFGELTEEEEEQRQQADAAFMWRIEAATQVLQLVATINALCELFEYKQPGLSVAVLPFKDTDAVIETGEEDALYGEALLFVRETRRPSISAIQRKLKIGYNRAARMIERMEDEGVVTAMNTNGSREVIAERF